MFNDARWKDDMHRLTDRFHRRKLDHQLSFGFDPNRDPARRRRAVQLTGESSRKDLAQKLERLVNEAAGSPHWQAPVRWADVRELSSMLTLLTQTLAGPTEVSAQGVARAELLLRDGTSPLYGPGGDDRLEMAIRSVLASLDLGPMLEPIRDWTAPPPLTHTSNPRALSTDQSADGENTVRANKGSFRPT